MYIYIYIYTYTHTHTHTQSKDWNFVNLDVRIPTCRDRPFLVLFDLS
jgi:hypothetical protein